MTRLMTIDVGNTHTVIGLYEGKKLSRHWRLSTRRERTADEVGLWLTQLLSRGDTDPESLDGIAVASVVPDVDRPLGEAVREYLGHEAFFVVPSRTRAMDLRVSVPEELGADRLCDAIAAYERVRGACVVLDFGTAVTWEVVSAAGEYLGGVIAPGPGITAGALFQRAAKLPDVAIAPPERVIGRGTVDSIQSGIFYGYLGLIEGLTRRVIDELGAPAARVIATGGFAQLFADHTELIDEVDPFLTLEGLRLLWEANREAEGR